MCQQTGNETRMNERKHEKHEPGAGYDRAWSRPKGLHYQHSLHVRPPTFCITNTIQQGLAPTNTAALVQRTHHRPPALAEPAVAHRCPGPAFPPETCRRRRNDNRGVRNQYITSCVRTHRVNSAVSVRGTWRCGARFALPEW